MSDMAIHASHVMHESQVPIMYHMHCMHVMYPHMHHMHGGIYIRKKGREGEDQSINQSSYVLNQELNNKKILVTSLVMYLVS